MDVCHGHFKWRFTILSWLIILLTCFLTNPIYSQKISDFISIESEKDTVNFLREGLKEVQIYFTKGSAVDFNDSQQALTENIIFNREGLVREEITYNGKSIYKRIEYNYLENKSIIKKEFNYYNVLVKEEIYNEGKLQNILIYKPHNGKMHFELKYIYKDNLLSKILKIKNNNKERLIAEQIISENQGRGLISFHTSQGTFMYTVIKNEKGEIERIEVHKNNRIINVMYMQKIKDKEDTYKIIVHFESYKKGILKSIVKKQYFKSGQLKFVENFKLLPGMLIDDLRKTSTVNYKYDTDDRLESVYGTIYDYTYINNPTEINFAYTYKYVLFWER